MSENLSDSLAADVVIEKEVQTEQVEQNVQTEQNTTSSVNTEYDIDKIMSLIDSGEVKLNVEKYGPDPIKALINQAKGYNELRKKLSTHKPAPEKYELNISEDYEDFGLSPDDPLLDKFNEYAKNHGLSQEAYSDILNFYLGIQKNNMSSVQETNKKYVEDELGKIGVNAKEKISNLVGWWANTFPDQDIEMFKSSIKSANDYFVLEKIKEKMTTFSVPKSKGTTQKEFTRNDLREMLKDKRMLDDPEYQRKVNELYESYINSES